MSYGTVYPKHGEEGNVARTLLALADDPMHVKTITDNGFAFLVPEYLLDRYVRSTVAQEEKPDALGDEQVRRRPGRPRKAVAPKEGD